MPSYTTVPGTDIATSCCGCRIFAVASIIFTFNLVPKESRIQPYIISNAHLRLSVLKFKRNKLISGSPSHEN